jgi:hypothetical protein
MFKSSIPNFLIGAECKYPLSSKLYEDSLLRSVPLYAQVCESVSVAVGRNGLTSVLRQMVSLHVFFCLSTLILSYLARP